jgi:diguanylate cyclase (GGDEF)-like protein
MTIRGQGQVAETSGALNSQDSSLAALNGLAQSELSPAMREALNALVAENKRLLAELATVKAQLSEAEVLADHDTLLPLLNRRAFLREFTRIVAYAKRYQEAAGLVYFDIDNFKYVNDTYGHAAGDEVLKHLARAIIENVRETDIVGRMGGDEFAVILVRSDEEAAQAKARSLAAMIADRPLLVNGTEIPLSISVGAI